MAATESPESSARSDEGSAGNGSTAERSASGHLLYPPRPDGWRRFSTPITVVAVFGFFAILPFFPVFAFTGIFNTGTDFGAGNLAFVFAFATAAVGFNLLIGYSGALGLAHAGLFALGAYGTAILSAPPECLDEGCDPIVREAVAGYGWPFLLTIPVVCAVAAFIGVIVGFPAARLRGFFLAIATLALGELIVTIIRLDDQVWSGLKTNGGTGKQVQIFRLFGAGPVRSAYYLGLAALLIVFVAYIILTERRLGRTLKAVRDIEIATGPIGISATGYKLVAFGLSAVAAALAGAAWAQNSAFVNPQSFRTRLLVFLLVVLIVGGVGRLTGPLIGAIFFVYLRQELQDTQKLLFLLIGIALMLSILVLPDGFASLSDRVRDSRVAQDLRRRLKTLSWGPGGGLR
ncbi:MAG: branched-chain amino acid ABC transporter permease [Acidimicrobiales bacterium]